MKKEEIKKIETEKEAIKEIWTAPKLTEINIASKTKSAFSPSTIDDGGTFSYS